MNRSIEKLIDQAIVTANTGTPVAVILKGVSAEVVDYSKLRLDVLKNALYISSYSVVNKKNVLTININHDE